MKKIGIVGGMSPESTIEYYKILIRAYQQRKGGVATPKVAIESLNLQRISTLMEKDTWDDVYAIILQAVRNLAGIGAEVVIMATNTPHKLFGRLQQTVTVPMISIMDATAEAVKAKRLQKVGLLGTRFTMQANFYPVTFAEWGIGVMTPSKKDQVYVDKVIWNELVHHHLKSSSKRGVLRVIERLQTRGAEGVVLGCTELPLLINQEDREIPLFDTTKLHAMKNLEYALQNEDVEGERTTGTVVRDDPKSA